MALYDMTKVKEDLQVTKESLIKGEPHHLR